MKHRVKKVKAVPQRMDTIYMGGELDSQDAIMPKNFAKFFTKSYLMIILLLIAVLFIFIFKIWGAIQ
ncbi:MAG: hypothetical protein ABIB71_09350 [Candidatus Woesearchaeota archaeon]